jgi:hypothetical protein
MIVVQAWDHSVTKTLMELLMMMMMLLMWHYDLRHDHIEMMLYSHPPMPIIEQIEE